MHLGVFSFNTEYSMRLDRLARAAEDRGFESLWVPEHSHIPVPGPGEPADPATGMPLSGNRAFFLPEEYRHIAAPLTSLAAAAAVTSRLKLGTCVCLINQHHPINLAKDVATLDRLSDGRFIFGIGAGWHEVEMGHHGIRLEQRWQQLRERLAAMRTLWREERAAFAGEFVEFAPSWQYPKPCHPDGPPVVLGTLDTPFGRSQVARYGDGWLPLTFDLDETLRSVAAVREEMVRHDRDPARLEVSLFFLDDALQPAAVLERARASGATRAIVRLPPADEATVLRTLDAYAAQL